MPIHSKQHWHTARFLTCLGNFSASLFPQYLLTRNPAVDVEKIEPVTYNLLMIQASPSKHHHNFCLLHRKKKTNFRKKVTKWSFFFTWKQIFTTNNFRIIKSMFSYSTSTLSWSLIRNSCVRSMPATMYGAFCLTAFLERPWLPSFKHSKRIFMPSQLKQVLRWLHVRRPSFLHFFTDQLNMDVVQCKAHTNTSSLFPSWPITALWNQAKYRTVTVAMFLCCYSTKPWQFLGSIVPLEAGGSPRPRGTHAGRKTLTERRRTRKPASTSVGIRGRDIDT